MITSKLKISKIRRFFLLFLYSLLFVLFTLSILVIGTPFYILRPCVKILARVFNKNLGKMVVSRAFLFAYDNFSSRPMYSILASFVYDEGFEIEKLHMLIQDAYFKNSKPDEVAELRQYISKWCGFLFWKNEDNFSLADHVRTYEGSEAKVETLTREGLFKIYKQLAVKPFGVEKSPWEIIYLPLRKCELEGISDGEKRSILFLKFHHALTDGFSLLKLLQKTTVRMDNMGLPIANFKKYIEPKSSFLHQVISFFKVFFTLPFEVAVFLEMMANDHHGLLVPKEKQKLSYASTFSRPIPLELFKEIKDAHEVSLNSLIYAGFTGAIRDFMIQRGMKVPEYIAYGIPMPRPNHPRKLRNHATVGIMRAPVGMENPTERLKFVDEELSRLKKSTIPYAGFYLTPMLGTLPCWLAKRFINTRFSTMISAFAGPSISLNCFGKEVKHAFFSCGIGGLGPLAIGVFSITYCGNIIIGTSFDECFIHTFESCEKFNARLVEEVKMLKLSPKCLEV